MAHAMGRHDHAEQVTCPFLVPLLPFHNAQYSKFEVGAMLLGLYAVFSERANYFAEMVTTVCLCSHVFADKSHGWPYPLQTSS